MREQWDFPLLESMSAFWAHSPPLHAMVAAYMGLKGEPEKATDLSEFFANVQMSQT